MNSNAYNSRILLSVLIASMCILVGVRGSASAYAGKEIVINLNDVKLTPINETGTYQVKVMVNYSVSDPTLIGQKINAVMKIRSSDGAILKTSSFPLGFTVNKTGITQFLTNIPRPLTQNITTETVFMNLNKTSALSNPLTSFPLVSKPVTSSEFTPTIIGNRS
jgi:hypothetical protein